MKQRSRRVRGEGSIYQAADGRWRGALVIVDPATGRRIRRVVSGRTASAARRNLEALRNTGGSPSAGTTGDYLTAWCQRVRPRLRPSTWLGYEAHVRRHLVPSLGGIRLVKLTPADVERMMAGALADGLTARTVASVRVTLRRALADAIRDGLVARNAAADARPPRVERAEIHPMTAAEVGTLLAATADDGLWGPFFTLALSTGLRSGELRGLAWADVDGERLTVRHSLRRGYERGTLELGEPKTSRSRRTIYLPRQAVEALDRRRVAQDADRAALGPDWQDTAGLVFTDSAGRPLPDYAATRAWHAALEAAGLPRYRLHDARHTAASLMLREGVPLKTISETLGHSTIGVTADVYAHLGDELRRDAADAIERALR
jgi:integrase